MKTWSKIYNSLPFDISYKLLLLKGYKENPQWHPEANCYIHIKIVTKRCIMSGNNDLICAGILHDICKLQTKKFNKKTGYNMSPGHEFAAVKFIEENQSVKDWITKDMNANLDRVIFIVKEHMRYKQLNKMKVNKANALKNHIWFDYLKTFSSFDSMKLNRFEVFVRIIKSWKLKFKND